MIRLFLILLYVFSLTQAQARIEGPYSSMPDSITFGNTTTVNLSGKGNYAAIKDLLESLKKAELSKKEEKFDAETKKRKSLTHKFRVTDVKLAVDTALKFALGGKKGLLTPKEGEKRNDYADLGKRQNNFVSDMKELFVFSRLVYANPEEQILEVVQDIQNQKKNLSTEFLNHVAGLMAIAYSTKFLEDQGALNQYEKKVGTAVEVKIDAESLASLKNIAVGDETINFIKYLEKKLKDGKGQTIVPKDGKEKVIAFIKSKKLLDSISQAILNKRKEILLNDNNSSQMDPLTANILGKLSEECAKFYMNADYNLPVLKDKEEKNDDSIKGIKFYETDLKKLSAKDQKLVRDAIKSMEKKERDILNNHRESKFKNNENQYRINNSEEELQRDFFLKEFLPALQANHDGISNSQLHQIIGTAKTLIGFSLFWRKFYDEISGQYSEVPTIPNIPELFSDDSDHFQYDENLQSNVTKLRNLDRSMNGLNNWLFKRSRYVGYYFDGDNFQSVYKTAKTIYDFRKQKEINLKIQLVSAAVFSNSIREGAENLIKSYFHAKHSGRLKEYFRSAFSSGHCYPYRTRDMASAVANFDPRNSGGDIQSYLSTTFLSDTNFWNLMKGMTETFEKSMIQEFKLAYPNFSKLEEDKIKGNNIFAQLFRDVKNYPLFIKRSLAKYLASLLTEMYKEVKKPADKQPLKIKYGNFIIYWQDNEYSNTIYPGYVGIYLPHTGLSPYDYSGNNNLLPEGWKSKTLSQRIIDFSNLTEEEKINLILQGSFISNIINVRLDKIMKAYDKLKKEKKSDSVSIGIDMQVYGEELNFAQQLFKVLFDLNNTYSSGKDLHMPNGKEEEVKYTSDLEGYLKASNPNILAKISSKQTEKKESSFIDFVASKGTDKFLWDCYEEFAQKDSDTGINWKQLSTDFANWWDGTGINSLNTFLPQFSYNELSQKINTTKSKIGTASAVNKNFLTLGLKENGRVFYGYIMPDGLSYGLVDDKFENFGNKKHVFDNNSVLENTGLINSGGLKEKSDQPAKKDAINPKFPKGIDDNIKAFLTADSQNDREDALNNIRKMYITSVGLGKDLYDEVGINEIIEYFKSSLDKLQFDDVFWKSLLPKIQEVNVKGATKLVRTQKPLENLEFVQIENPKDKGKYLKLLMLTTEGLQIYYGLNEDSKIWTTSIQDMQINNFVKTEFSFEKMTEAAEKGEKKDGKEEED